MNQKYKKRVEDLLQDHFYSKEMLLGAIRKCRRSIQYYTSHLEHLKGDALLEDMQKVLDYVDIRNRCIDILREYYHMSIDDIERGLTTVDNRHTPSDAVLEEIGNAIKQW